MVKMLKYRKRSSKKPSKSVIISKKVVKVRPVITKTGRAYRQIGRSLGRQLGGYTGVPFGAYAGGILGKLMGAGISKITGHGDYHMLKSNSLIKGYADGNSPPSFQTVKDGIEICHREYIGEVTSSTAFSVNYLLDLNPGLPATFPWLSQIAVNFETYKMLGCVFEFKSMSADALNSTNTALGTVILAPQYNALSAQFVNKQQMESYDGAVSVKPSESVLLGIECAKSSIPLDHLYIRNGVVPSGQDEKLYDIASVTLATQGMQASADIGELWVSYHVRLYQPKLIGGNLGQNILWSHIFSANPTCSSTNPLGLATTLSVLGNAGVGSSSSTTINFPAYIIDGAYQLSYNCSGASTAGVAGPSIAFTTNCSALFVFQNDTTGGIRNLNDTNAHAMAVTYFTITGPNAVITFSSGSYPTSQTALDVVITQIDPLII